MAKYLHACVRLYSYPAANFQESTLLSKYSVAGSRNKFRWRLTESLKLVSTMRIIGQKLVRFSDLRNRGRLQVPSKFERDSLTKLQ